MQKKEKIVVLGGSFNPPTVGHLRLLVGAVDAIGADRGIFVPSSHAYVEKKMAKTDEAWALLSEKTRYDMLAVMAKTDARLSVDGLEYRYSEKRYSYDTMCALSASYPDAELYFLIGADKLHILHRWHRIEDFLSSFRFLVTRRDGDDPERMIGENELLKPYRDRFVLIDTPSGLEGISSSRVRELLSQGEKGADRYLTPEAFEILASCGGMGIDTVFGFRGEYRFLSNFWGAPITYRGLTYLNNEAAFQAQKCVSEKEKLAFVGLSPEKAKALGRRVLLRPDWDAVRLSVMEDIVYLKFKSHPELCERLLQTGERRLVEGNHWHDRFWGVDHKTLVGKNHLGRILMRVRDRLRAELTNV